MLYSVQWSPLQHGALPRPVHLHLHAVLHEAPPDGGDRHLAPDRGEGGGLHMVMVLTTCVTLVLCHLDSRDQVQAPVHGVAAVIVPTPGH